VGVAKAHGVFERVLEMMLEKTFCLLGPYPVVPNHGPYTTEKMLLNEDGHPVLLLLQLK